MATHNDVRFQPSISTDEMPLHDDDGYVLDAEIRTMPHAIGELLSSANAYAGVVGDGYTFRSKVQSSSLTRCCFLVFTKVSP